MPQSRLFGVKRHHTTDKTWWEAAAQQNQINMGKQNCTSLQGMVSWLS